MLELLGTKESPNTGHDPQAGILELSDLVVAFDSETLARTDVRKQDVLEQLVAAGDYQAARCVEQLPDRDGVLQREAVDQQLLTAHYELQRMSEEFVHGHRVAELLRPLISAIGDRSHDRPIRVVDIGCGTGFVIRWLAARASLGRNVELVGVDFNPTLVDEARQLAAAERLDCGFEVANAFRLDHPGTIFISTGVLHHFRGESLANFMSQHESADTIAFAHFDFQPSRVAPIGAWLFHLVRMRSRLSRHDGVASAIRAHDAKQLLLAAREGLPEFRSSIYGKSLWRLPVPRVFQTLVGVRPVYWNSFINALGGRAGRLCEPC